MARRIAFVALLGILASTYCLLAQPLFSAVREPAQVDEPTKGPVPRSASPQVPASLLVLPFENSSHLTKLDWLGEGLAELTFERLDAAGQFVVNRDEAQAAMERLGLPISTRFSRATMLKIAEEVDADWVVFGQYASDGKTFSATARVLHVKPPRLAPVVEEKGTPEELMDIHARLAWRLLTRVEPGYPVSQHDFMQEHPRLRLNAFEHYIQGLLSSEDDQRIREFRAAARLEPSWGDPAFALAQVYFGRRDCASALPWFSRVPPGHKRGLEASFSAGVCHLLRNDPARAEAAFASLLEHLPTSGTRTREVPEALNNLAVARGRLGKSREAAAAFERATQVDPEEADYWFNLGLIGLRAGDPATAVRPLREVLRRQPADDEARALLVASLERLGRTTEAATEREPMGRSSDSLALTPESLARLDRVKMKLDTASSRPVPETPGHAASELSGQAAHKVQHVQLHRTRGQQSLAAGQLDAAEREFTEVILLAPQDSAAHLSLAEVYQRQKRYSDAIREIRVALASRDDAATRIALARIYVEQNQAAKAHEELRRARKLDPDNADARKLLEQLEARTGPGGPR